MERETIEGHRVEVDVHRLRELPDDPTVLPVHRAQTDTRPSATSSWVRAVRSMPTPISFGSNDSCVAQFSVIPLRRSPARLPSTYKPDGMVHSTRRRSLS